MADPTPDPFDAARRDLERGRHLLAGPRRLKRRSDLAGDLLALVVTVAVVVGMVVLLAAGLAGVGT